MYIPPIYKQENWNEIRQIIEQHNFAILVNQTNQQLWATHLPLVLEQRLEEYYLLGHLAKANPQWKHFTNNNEVLIIFQAEHAYISPTWYNHKNVPTWNYQAVHVYADIQIVHGKAVYEGLQKLMAKHEAQTQTNMDITEIPKETMREDMQGLVGFELKIKRVEAVQKMSQNRDEESYRGVINGLREQGQQGAADVAKTMETLRKEE